MENDFKILIISHNPLSLNNNMGKTISSFIKMLNPKNVAQLYLHSGKPNCPNCLNYYQFSDEDALKSIFNRRIKGNIAYNNQLLDQEKTINNSLMHEVGRKRYPLICFARDMIWKLSNVSNSKIYDWINDFDPDVVFFAAGDYRFSFRLVEKIVNKINKPLVSCFFDDFYFHCNYKRWPLGRLYFNSLRKAIKKNIELSSLCFGTNYEMSNKYSLQFGKTFRTLFTSCESSGEIIPFSQKKNICYLGGIGLKRDHQLIKLGRAINETNGMSIVVYSNESNKKTIQRMKNAKGIDYRGCVSPKDVPNIIAHSKAVLHVESFDKKLIERTKYSLSTKIAESLGSRTLLIAYGPKNVASIKYLVDNQAALISDDANTLAELINDIISDDKKYCSIVKNAYDLYLKNHTPESVGSVFRSEIIEVLRRIK